MAAGASAEPVAIIESVAGNGDRALVMAVWSDGRLVWSAEPNRGGPPLSEAIVESKEVAACIQEVAQDALIDGQWTGERDHGPDSQWIHVMVRQEQRVVVDVGSWHEVFEADPRLVATAAGIVPLGGRTRGEVLAQQPAEYRFFRRRWDFVLSKLRGLASRAESSGSSAS